MKKKQITQLKEWLATRKLAKPIILTVYKKKAINA